MDLKEIALALTEGCKSGGELANLDKLYASDAVSVEAQDYSGMGRETKGRDGIKGKHAWWEANFELHSAETIGPFIGGDNQFVLHFSVDATHTESGERSQMREVGIYTVENGKIIREEFLGLED
ncbi:MAG: SnoaL-like domain-containing protein [Mangrovicoccus sp.]